MITKERVALFLGGVMLVGSLEISFYGGNFYVAAFLLIVGALCLICGITLNQQRYNVTPILERELQSLNREMRDLKAIIEKSPKQEDAVSIIERISALVDLSRESGKSLEQLMPFTEGEISKINHEIAALKEIMEDTPKRGDLKKLTEELSAFSGLPVAIDSSLNKFLSESKKINDMTHEGHEKILADTRKNNEELIEACRNTIEDAVSKIRQDLSKVIEDADILKNDYLSANNELIEKQSRIAEDTGKNIVSMCQDTENKMNAILAKIQQFSENTGEQILTLDKNLNDMAHEGHEKILADNRKNNEDLIEVCRNTIEDAVSKIRQDLSKVIEDADILKNDYLNANNELIEKQSRIAEDTGKNIVSMCQDTENKMNAILAKIQQFSEDTGEQILNLDKNLNDNVKELCDNISDSIEELDDGIKKKHAKLVDKLSDDVESMSQSISALAESYDNFKAHNESLVKAFTKMSEEDAEIIRSILPN